jgi:hypothetical protein
LIYRRKINPGVSQGFAAFVNGEKLAAYFDERRRALIRVRAVAKKAPAEPTIARIAVGFSGEFVQPFCACSGRVTLHRRARPRNIRVDFFIKWSPVGKVLVQKSICQRRKPYYPVIPIANFGAGDEKELTAGRSWAWLQRVKNQPNQTFWSFCRKYFSIVRSYP